VSIILKCIVSWEGADQIYGVKGRDQWCVLLFFVISSSYEERNDPLESIKRDNVLEWPSSR
jgi:hypothetical protein